MTKEDLSRALSLSCVENYFLAFFKDKFDERMLFVESFAPFNKVVQDFLINNAIYENYPLIRVQDTAEKLGMVSHKLCSDLKMEENALNLIRVNERFFENSKLTPWRADHFIAVEKAEGGMNYFNNFPLSSGELTEGRIKEVYDNLTLNYWLEYKACGEKYDKLASRQFNSIAHDDVYNFTLTREGILQFRNAILVLKTLRKRLVKWLEYMTERGEFLIDIAFINFTNNLITCYEKLFITIEFQLARKK